MSDNAVLTMVYHNGALMVNGSDYELPLDRPSTGVKFKFQVRSRDSIQVVRWTSDPVPRVQAYTVTRSAEAGEEIPLMPVEVTDVMTS